MRMQWSVRLVAVMAVGAMMFGLSARTELSAGDTPDIKTIMKKVNGKDGLKTSLTAATKGKPDWDAVAEQSKELVSLAEAMGKNTPPKGDAKSWEKLTKAYLKNATAVAAAAEKKDVKGFASATTKFFSGATCGGCHKSHK
ncbi:hypothetical protein [Tuwongella immobilis]|uniref:Cytochrome c-556: Cytochrome C n=1 Tax=Tuwongella immobilis TaxID=692036 RepID=A0A6C2YPU7_9BACT|nr:hypothetical protein [Tuwongella immobilis]VIP03658.1 cytochrome c-556 : Cytochrome C OS=Singulisphaera acidiphila (strain ATCC BAA-1392 / DSM 18658 / VKM B-2454 / MOB10) GN=Sinac_3849 PE=4 SV=1 [Tuwongella immobilis]VTS04684.1 cytochrome c-556 : Cytochrome C OS=Singulisphaera acidiphila (strain ATCC BAA-1392 / DSM 18658 / VKM B-2454 / MOB10) GN=Sinac_3849 PE=4 SV=1 [Tuwongella immobilis]